MGDEQSKEEGQDKKEGAEAGGGSANAPPEQTTANESGPLTPRGSQVENAGAVQLTVAKEEDDFMGDRTKDDFVGREKRAKERFNLPDWEVMQDWFHCAISEEILKQEDVGGVPVISEIPDSLAIGKMCVFLDWIVFYCDIPLLQREVAIPIGDIVQMSKEKTAFVFENALQITLEGGTEHMFRSFMDRDRTLKLIEARRAAPRRATLQELTAVKGGKEALHDRMADAAALLLQPEEEVLDPNAGPLPDISIDGIPRGLRWTEIVNHHFELPPSDFCDAVLVKQVLPWKTLFEAGDLVSYDIVKAFDFSDNGAGTEERLMETNFKTKIDISVPLIKLPEFGGIHRIWRLRVDRKNGRGRMHIRGTTEGTPYSNSYAMHGRWTIRSKNGQTHLKVEEAVEWLASCPIKSIIRKEVIKGNTEGMEDFMSLIIPELKKLPSWGTSAGAAVDEESDDEPELRGSSCCQKCTIL